jgi:hypothetical protein
MVVAGQRIIVPRNLVVELPAAWISLVDLMLDSPPECANQQPPQSGLASADSCLQGRPGAYATILANRVECGDLIAGDVFIAKSAEDISGVITFLNYNDGYVRLNGIVGSDQGGTILRINDPTARHTLQQGLGCGVAGTNCSADPRFGVDFDNYTVAFRTGYPLCIPSTMTGGLRTSGSDANGAGDPFCPTSNRALGSGLTVPDATRFAPLQVGDHLLASGNFETVNGVRFYSAHTIDVSVALFTRDDPSQPDYISFAEVAWDTAGFANERVRLLLIGRSTLPDSQVDIFTLRVDPRDNTNHEHILASTVNNIDFTNQGIPPNGGGIWKVLYDVDFLARLDARRLPCATLALGAPSPLPPSWQSFSVNCGSGAGLAGEFRMLSPISREIIGHTRRRAPVTAIARDIQGIQTTSSQYLTPIGVGHSEFDEIDLNRFQTPYTFAGIPWNMDRRLSPAGCGETGCESTPQPLDPFPFEGATFTAAGSATVDMHPGHQVIGTPDANRPLAFFTADGDFLQSHLFTWPPAAPTCTPTGGTGGGGTGGGGGVPVQAVNDLLVTPAGAPLVISAAQLLANDVGAGLTLASIDTASSAGGTVVNNGNGTFTFTPRANFAGVDTFQYTVSDGVASSIGTVSVTVTDAELPTVSFIAPASGTTVTGIVQVAASATDNIGIGSVTFLMNGVVLGVPDNTAPYTAIWNTTGLPNGNYVITAIATDRFENSSNPASITLVINTPPPPPPPPPPSTGLVLALGFDEAGGATAVDSSPTGGNGTITGAVRVPGRVGSALSFNGVGDLVTVPNAAALNLTSTMTLEAWIQPTALTGWHTVLLKEGAGTMAYEMYANNDVSRPAAYFTTPGGGIRAVTGTAVMPSNVWTHLAMAYDGAAMRLYVNGVLVRSVARTGAILVTDGPLHIGGNEVWGGEFFQGLIDEVRIYNRALTQAEIAADMSAGTVPTP